MIKRPEGSQESCVLFGCCESVQTTVFDSTEMELRFAPEMEIILVVKDKH